MLLQRYVDATNASNVFSSVSSNPYGRDLAWAAFRARTADFLGWYGYRSTLASLARSLIINFHSMEYAANITAVWSGLAGASVADGAWHRGVERVVAAAGWEATERAAVCAFLETGWAAGAAAAVGGSHVQSPPSMRAELTWEEV
jgi:hypothetical protein